MTDPFAVLGINPQSSPDMIRQRWLLLARSHHPDIGGDKVAFDLYRRAYDAARRIAADTPCPVCSGRGTITILSGINALDMPCRFCSGSGKKY